MRANYLFKYVSGFALAAALFFAGCVTSEIYESWKGAHVSELVASWGKPQKTRSLRNGGKVYIYDQTPGETRRNYLDNYTGPTKLIAYYVHKNGIIYKWKQKPLSKSLFD